MADVFVDRDGVINRNRPDNVKSWTEFEFLPGSVEALAQLTRRGHRTFVITNQSVVNRGLVSPEVMAGIHKRMIEEVARHGGAVDAVLVCPHVPEEACPCRKPMPGLLLRARETLGAILEKAYVIGDFVSDLGAAWAAGCAPILVLTGRGRHTYETMSPEERQRCWVAQDLSHAVELIGANGRPLMSTLPLPDRTEGALSLVANRQGATELQLSAGKMSAVRAMREASASSRLWPGVEL